MKSLPYKRKHLEWRFFFNGRYPISTSLARCCKSYVLIFIFTSFSTSEYPWRNFPNHGGLIVSPRPKWELQPLSWVCNTNLKWSWNQVKDFVKVVWHEKCWKVLQPKMNERWGFTIVPHYINEGIDFLLNKGDKWERSGKYCHNLNLHMWPTPRINDKTFFSQWKNLKISKWKWVVTKIINS